MTSADLPQSSVITTPIMIIIIFAITIPVIVGLVIIIRASRRATVKEDMSEEQTTCGDIESHAGSTGTAAPSIKSDKTTKSLKEAVLESYRSKRSSQTSVSGPRSSEPSQVRVVKYKQSKPRPLILGPDEV